MLTVTAFTATNINNDIRVGELGQRLTLKNG